VQQCTTASQAVAADMALVNQDSSILLLLLPWSAADVALSSKNRHMAHTGSKLSTLDLSQVLIYYLYLPPST